eukprot:2237269-Karenia_brevis.AAC.1
MRCSTHRGSDVRLATGTLLKPDIWPRQSLVSAWWKWRVMLSYALHNRHINVHEMIAVLQTWKWRCRNNNEIGK